MWGCVGPNLDFHVPPAIVRGIHCGSYSIKLCVTEKCALVLQKFKAPPSPMQPHKAAPGNAAAMAALSQRSNGGAVTSSSVQGSDGSDEWEDVRRNLPFSNSPDSSEIQTCLKTPME